MSSAVDFPACLPCHLCLWSEDVQNVVGVWASEVIVDVLKHAFLAKFNDLSPDVYSSFLLSMCKQVRY